MKRLLIAALCLIPAAHSTVISGKISDLTGQIMTANRTVVFSLMNCGNNIPRVNGSSVVAPASKTILPNAAGLLTGTLIGNDILECGTVIGQTYYNVEIFAGTQKIYGKLFYISGPAWNITTAVPLSNDPTAFMNFTGYLLGDLIYGAGTNSLGLIRGNHTTGVMFLAQVGDGVNSGQPFWANPMATLHTTDLSDFITSVDGRITAQKGTANGLAILDGTGKLASPVPISVLIAGDYSGKITSGTYSIGISGNAATASSINWTGVNGRPTALSQFTNDSGFLNSITGSGAGLTAGTVPISSLVAGDYSAKVTSGTYSVNISGNAATVTNGVYTNGGPYSDPSWLTISKSKVGLSLVENTALSTWAGTENITAIGTLASGTVPWARLSGVPAVSVFTNDAGYLTSASSLAWAKLTGVPAVSVFSNDAGYLTSASSLAWGKLTGVPTSFPSAQIMKNGTNVGTPRDKLNFIEGANILLAVTDDGGKVNVEVSASGSFSATMAGDVSGATGSNVVDFVGGASAASIAAVATSGILSTGSYPDPSWLTISKSKVGLSLVENTALSTWAGSSNITAVGTLASGTVPWARLSGVPAGVWNVSGSDINYMAGNVGIGTTAPITLLDLRFAADHVVRFRNTNGLEIYAATDANTAYVDLKINGSTLFQANGNVSVSGTVTATQFLGSGAGLTAGTVPIASLAAGDYSGKITSGTYNIGISGNAATVGGLAISSGANSGVNEIVRTDAAGYINSQWINTNSGDSGTSAISRVYASQDSFLRYYSLANFTKQVVNAYVHEASFVWQDNYIALPTGTVQWGVFASEASQNTITKVQCWSDTGDAVLQLKRSDGGDMISGNVACNGSASTSFNGYQVIPAGYYVGMWAVSGNAKRINVAITYTTSY